MPNRVAPSFMVVGSRFESRRTLQRSLRTRSQHGSMDVVPLVRPGGCVRPIISNRRGARGFPFLSARTSHGSCLRPTTWSAPKRDTAQGGDPGLHRVGVVEGVGGAGNVAAPPTQTTRVRTSKVITTLCALWMAMPIQALR